MSPRINVYKRLYSRAKPAHLPPLRPLSAKQKSRNRAKGRGRGRAKSDTSLATANLNSSGSSTGPSGRHKSRTNKLPHQRFRSGSIPANLPTTSHSAISEIRSSSLGSGGRNSSRSSSGNSAVGGQNSIIAWDSSTDPRLGMVESSASGASSARDAQKKTNSGHNHYPHPGFATTRRVRDCCKHKIQPKGRPPAWRLLPSEFDSIRKF